MSLVKQLNGGSSWYNTGKTGNVQLVDAEQSMTFHNIKVLIGHYRDAVSILGKTTLQRTPFSLVTKAKDLLSTKLASQMDKGVFYTLYSGHSPNIHRELGTTAVPAAAHPNIMYGKGQSALTGVGPSDLFDTDLLEREAAFVAIENINPIMVDGEPHFIHFCHPLDMKNLRADSLWQDANINGMGRGADNPMFSGAKGMWAGIVVKTSNNVDTAKTYSALTVSNDSITLSAATVTGTATDFRMNVLLGANAIARGFGHESYMERRKEDDYGNIMAWGGGYIYGDRRADWAVNADSGTDGATTNQSSCLVYTYAPSQSLPTTWS